MKITKISHATQMYYKSGLWLKKAGSVKDAHGSGVTTMEQKNAGFTRHGKEYYSIVKSEMTKLKCNA